MQTTRYFRYLAMILIVGILAGCGGPGASTSAIDTTVDVSKLPKLNENGYMLDNDSLEVLAPEGWRRGSRTEKALAKFHANSSNNPFVYVHSEASKSPTSLTADGVLAFKQKIAAELEAENIQPASPLRTFKVGDRVGVYYLRVGRDKDDARIERLYAVTVANGHRYTLEMIGKNTDLNENSDNLWALLYGMKFGKAAAADAAPATDTPGIGLPAEGTPATDAPAVDAPADDAAAEDAPAEE